MVGIGVVVDLAVRAHRRPCRRDDEFNRMLASEILEMLVFEGVSWVVGGGMTMEGMTMEGVTIGEATMETAATVFQRSWNARFRRGEELGLRRGEELGLRKGEEQGQARILRQLATRKFGSAAEAELSKALGGRMSPEQAGRLADAVLESDSADEFLGRVREVAAR